MAWEIELTDAARDWLLDVLDDDGRRKIVPAIEELEEIGPTLGRPTVDRVKASRHHNAFDPERKAILLIGGDKTGQWKSWYSTNIPVADEIYDEHLENL